MRSDGCAYSVGKGGSTEKEIPESVAPVTFFGDLMVRLSIILINLTVQKGLKLDN